MVDQVTDLDTELKVERNVERIKDAVIPWSKSLGSLPLFMIKEIELYKLRCGRKGKAIIKTRDRVRCVPTV